VHVLRRHQVAGRRRRYPVEQVRLQSGDPPRDVGSYLGCPAGATFQGDGGQVDGGDPPSALGQPDRVRTLPAADVERSSGREVGYLGRELQVRVTC
jgi:hypothetical protein